MRNFWLLLACLFCIGLPAHAQQGAFKISASTSRAQFNNRTFTSNGGTYYVNGRIMQSYGANFEYYVGDFISMAYTFEWGNTSQNARFTRYPLGIHLSAIPFANARYSTNGDWLYAALLLAITPEALYFHIPIQEEKFYITPYISPLNIYREKTPNYAAAPSAGFAIGSKLEVFYKHFTFAPYLGTRTLYRRMSGAWGIEGGLTAGFLIND